MNKDLSMTKILVVDDEERLLRALRLGLKNKGYEVVTAQSGEEAIRRLCDQPFDILLTDIHMQNMTGVELVYEVERLNIDVAVIVMTAFADVHSAVKSLKHGAFDYVQKPFTVDELDKVLTEALQQKAARQKKVLPTMTEGISDTEKELIIRALERTNNVKSKAAKLLNISDRTLWYKIKKYNI
ncbi:MAG: response regulator [Candidatus Omnitrophica bacterium]|nr:response regulator [Candidatus Omnitrophota bacterium]